MSFHVDENQHLKQNEKWIVCGEYNEEHQSIRNPSQRVTAGNFSSHQEEFKINENEEEKLIEDTNIQFARGKYLSDSLGCPKLSLYK